MKFVGLTLFLAAICISCTEIYPQPGEVFGVYINYKNSGDTLIFPPLRLHDFYNGAFQGEYIHKRPSNSVQDTHTYVIQRIARKSVRLMRYDSLHGNMDGCSSEDCFWWFRLYNYDSTQTDYTFQNPEVALLYNGTSARLILSSPVPWDWQASKKPSLIFRKILDY